MRGRIHQLLATEKIIARAGHRRVGWGVSFLCIHGYGREPDGVPKSKWKFWRKA